MPRSLSGLTYAIITLSRILSPTNLDCTGLCARDSSHWWESSPGCSEGGVRRRGSRCRSIRGWAGRVGRRVYSKCAWCWQRGPFRFFGQPL